LDRPVPAEDLEAWEERRLEAEEYIDAGDRVVVLLHEYPRGRGSGIELELKGYMDRAAALQAAGLSK
jgi:hypothetical protein